MKKWELLMSPEGDVNAGAPAVKPEAAQQQTTPPNGTTTETQGDQFDDLGYKIQKPEAAKNSEGETAAKPKQDTPPAQPEEIKDPVSGYDKEPVVPKVEEVPPAPKEETPAVEFSVEGLPEEVGTSLKKLASDMKLTKEAAEALVAIRKKDFESFSTAQKEIERQQSETKLKWYNELKSDPHFGGDKYAFNVNRVEKVLNEFMPDTKKVLTERKSMLPPYVMRGLAKIADQLYGTESLVQGGAKVPTPDETKVDDVLSFYS